MSDTPRASEARLDSITEDAIFWLESRVIAGQGFREARGALRSRIRTLIEEAGREGFRNVTDVSHLIEFPDAR
jgi:hypothetical protein